MLLARTSVEIPGNLQKLLEFWTPLHVYKECPCPPGQAGISCFTSSFPSQYQKQAVCFTVSLFRLRFELLLRAPEFSAGSQESIFLCGQARNSGYVLSQVLDRFEP